MSEKLDSLKKECEAIEQKNKKYSSGAFSKKIVPMVTELIPSFENKVALNLEKFSKGLNPPKLEDTPEYKKAKKEEISKETAEERTSKNKAQYEKMSSDLKEDICNIINGMVMGMEYHRIFKEDFLKKMKLCGDKKTDLDKKISFINSVSDLKEGMKPKDQALECVKNSTATKERCLEIVMYSLGRDWKQIKDKVEAFQKGTENLLVPIQYKEIDTDKLKDEYNKKYIVPLNEKLMNAFLVYVDQCRKYFEFMKKICEDYVKNHKKTLLSIDKLKKNFVSNSLIPYLKDQIGKYDKNSAKDFFNKNINKEIIQVDDNLLNYFKN